MEAIIIAILIFGAIVAQTLVYQKKFFKKLVYTCDFTKHRAKVGDTVELIETVTNRKSLPIPWLRVSIFSSKWLEYADNLSTVIDENRFVSSIFYTGGKKRTKRTWSIKCIKRGFFEVSNITLIGGDPLGFTTVSKGADVSASILVYPDAVDIDKHLVPLNILSGDTIVRRWISDDPFLVAGVRQYTPADTMNRIHMKATARMGHLMVKKCDFTSSITMTILLNMQSVERETGEVVDKRAIENGIRIAAGFFANAQITGVPFRFASNGVTLDDPDDYVNTDSKAGEVQYENLLEILAKLKMGYKDYFNRFLTEITSGIRDSEVAIITAFVDDEMAEHMRSMLLMRNSVKLIMLDYSVDTSKVPEGVEMFLYRKKAKSEVIE